MVKTFRVVCPRSVGVWVHPPGTLHTAHLGAGLLGVEVELRLGGARLRHHAARRRLVVARPRVEYQGAHLDNAKYFYREISSVLQRKT